MSMIPHEFLYVFENEEISVMEVKRKDQAKDAFPDQIYFWILMDKKKNSFVHLGFKSMGTEMVNGNNINVRVFQKAELRFDANFAKFVYLDQSYLLETKAPTSVSQDTVQKVLNFIIQSA